MVVEYEKYLPDTKADERLSEGEAELSSSSDEQKNEEKPTDTDCEAAHTVSVKPAQTKEQNAEFARRRREEKYKADIMNARNEGVIKALGGKNPYTGKELSTNEDIGEFFLMKQMKEAGNGEFDGFIERKRLEAERENSEKSKAEWYKKDRDKFSSEHPDVSISDLVKDGGFCRFAKGRVGITPLSEIYSDYLELKAELRESADSMAAQAYANSISSPGSLSSNDSESDFFTPEQVDSMNQKEILDNYDRIRESMKYWK